MPDEHARTGPADLAFPLERPERAAYTPIDGWLRPPGLTVDASVAPLRPLVVERDGRRLTIQILRDRRGPFLLLSERKLCIAPADIASLGLSPRENRVVAWLAHGKSNAEIAGILGLSPATIKHCLERVYGKLDVGTRAAATAVAVDSRAECTVDGQPSQQHRSFTCARESGLTGERGPKATRHVR